MTAINGCMYGGSQLNNATWWAASAYSADTMPSVAACNYDATANVDNGTCNYVYGCTDPLAVNYDGVSTTCDDGSCVVCSNIDTSLAITTTDNTDTTTPNGSATITPSATAEDTPYTYTFSDSAGNGYSGNFLSTSGTTTTISGLSAETYTVNITTANG